MGLEGGGWGERGGEGRPPTRDFEGGEEGLVGGGGERPRVVEGEGEGEAVGAGVGQMDQPLGRQLLHEGQQGLCLVQRVRGIVAGSPRLGQRGLGRGLDVEGHRVRSAVHHPELSEPERRGQVGSEQRPSQNDCFVSVEVPAPHPTWCW